MHLRSLLIAAAVGVLSVKADRVFAKDNLSPTTTSEPLVSDLNAAFAYQASVGGEILERLTSWYTAMPTGVASVVDSANSELSRFTETATYDFMATPTGTQRPEWYTALPTEVREVLDYEICIFESIASDVEAEATRTPGGATSTRPTCTMPPGSNEASGRAAGFAGLAVVVAAGAMLL